MRRSQKNMLRVNNAGKEKKVILLNQRIYQGTIYRGCQDRRRYWEGYTCIRSAFRTIIDIWCREAQLTTRSRDYSITSLRHVGTCISPRSEEHTSELLTVKSRMPSSA